MNWKLMFSRDTRHIRIILLLLLVGGGAAAWLRSQMVPKSYGELGRYRADALQEIAAHPLIVQPDETCLKCHDHVREERSESPHKAVACNHCHGIGRQHVADAQKAETHPDFELPPAEEWHGDFEHQPDLFITHDRAACLACHLKVVGMPESFRSINVAEHLKEQEASEPNSRNVCFECHEGHSPL